MNTRLRLWLRRHLWLWWVFAALLGLGSAVLTGFVMAGYRPDRFSLVLWAGIPVANSYVIWYVTAESQLFRRLLSSALREDAPASSPR